MKTYGILIVLVLLMLSGCSTNTNVHSRIQEIDNTFEKTISEPIVQNVSGGEILGDISKNGFSVKISDKTFDESSRVSVFQPERIPDYEAERFTLLSSPFEINSEITRFNEPIRVSFLLTEDEVKEYINGNIKIVYFNGKDWDIIPTSIQGQEIYYESFHASLFGKGKVTIKERLNSYAHSQTASEIAEDNVNEIIDEMISDTVDHVLDEKLGISETSAKSKILKSLITDDSYSELVEQFKSGDRESFMKDLAIFTGTKIAENVAKSSLQSALEGLTSDSGIGMVEAGSTAAGYLIEGDFSGAGRIIGEHIADQMMITKIVKIGAEVVDYNIELWKDSEIEAAYIAYRDGAEDGFWGYDVDSKDMDALYLQMRGISTRLESEAVEREIARRENLGKRPATKDELDKIRRNVKLDLENKFKERLSEEKEFKSREEEMNKFISAFEGSNLLKEGYYGYDEDVYSLESRLDQLMHLKKKILHDTGRKKYHEGNFITDDSIPMSTMLSLMRAYYSPDGKKAYEEMLSKEFGLGKDIGIQEDFDLIYITEVSNDYQRTIRNSLFEKAPIEVRNGRFSSRYSGSISGDDYDMTTGIKLDGTYDKRTGNFSGTYSYNWDGERKGRAEKIVYSGKFSQIISSNTTQSDISLKGTIQSTTISNNKPSTTTTEGGPKVKFRVSILKK